MLKKKLEWTFISFGFIMTLAIAMAFFYFKEHAPNPSLISEIDSIKERYVLISKDGAVTIERKNDFTNALKSFYQKATTNRIFLGQFNGYYELDELKNDLVMKEIACMINQKYSDDWLFMVVSRFEEVFMLFRSVKPIDEMIPYCEATK